MTYLSRNKLRLNASNLLVHDVESLSNIVRNHMVVGITMSSLLTPSWDHMNIELSSLGKLKLGSTIKFHIASAWLQLNKQ